MGKWVHKQIEEARSHTKWEVVKYVAGLGVPVLVTTATGVIEWLRHAPTKQIVLLCVGIFIGCYAVLGVVVLLVSLLSSKNKTPRTSIHN